MRLTCPNCAAQYEVDDSVIPPDGRDVQCSDCGHGWYQYPTGMTTRLTPPEAAADPPDDAAAEEAHGTEAQEAPATETPHASDEDDAEAEPDEAPASNPAVPPARERLDESVLGILREEAERETRARQAERRSALETQPELGIEAAPRPPQPASPNAKDWGAVDTDAAYDADPDAHEAGDKVTPRPVRPASRRHQLPDIEEINSSLRASSERRPGEAGAEALPAQTGARRKGFRLGLALVLSLAAIAVGIYALAPTAAQTWPAVAPYFEGYVAAVDEGRRWIGATAQDATEALTEALAGQN